MSATDAQRQAVGSASRRATYPGFRNLVKAVGTGERGRRALTSDEAHEAMRAMLTGAATGAQIGAFLMAMRIKGETVTEMTGLVRALRESAVPLRADTDRPLVACAGAYDGVAETPQLSLAAGAVAAACGAGVVIHCGTPLGPKYGVTHAEVLGALGGPELPGPEQSRRMLEASGVTVVNAAACLPGWAELAAVRDEIGPRGPVHSAEKLVDWFGARRFTVGFTHGPYADRLLGALTELGADAAIAIRGSEGQDVLRPGRPVAQDASGRLELPEELGLNLGDARGVEASAELTRAVLAGRAEPAAELAVALTAGLRLLVCGLAPTPLRGMAAARAAIADGRAQATLDAALSAAS